MPLPPVALSLVSVSPQTAGALAVLSMSQSSPSRQRAPGYHLSFLTPRRIRYHLVRGRPLDVLELHQTETRAESWLVAAVGGVHYGFFGGVPEPREAEALQPLLLCLFR
ncbi:hypothetical protein CPLU01_07668 [Colletotrichum plurivorum]|uniref:Uncharacterized protein n=1 Tax=Colletotrichum plurivorum TaxID=2175906 RepID=A0A8H6KET3_9PEZI|nr:hypothetical protein CPLU01_07668 [Colletotrichum plurivorum]